MPIKIVPQGKLYTAEVTPPQGNWRSPHPMRSDELGRKLLSIGCDPLEIIRSLRGAGVQSHGGWYHEFAEETGPRLQAALAGEIEVSLQPPFTEAWLAFALFEGESALSLEEVMEAADSINHAVPNPDEIAWAFVQLRGRDWLVIEGDQYSLTANARRAIDAIRDGAWAWEGVKRLEEWILSHPPPGDE